ncbi:sulfatase [Saccharopolyspora erythraea]|uniref:sulfatase family protein n=1 Tax=Saccharopolyspora erythraea TaxID=1836 RepID=UPI003082FAEC
MRRALGRRRGVPAHPAEMTRRFRSSSASPLTLEREHLTDDLGPALRSRNLLTRFLAATSALFVLAACGNAPASPLADQAADAPPRPPGAAKPNVVVVLTDDLSSDLVRYLPEVQRMQRQGADFPQYSVTDSLCCPSRSSLLSGKYPHNTGVFTNSGADGGFHKFHETGGERSTIGTQLQGAGYQTAFMGKYMNGYRPDGTVDGTPNYVPPGWNTWAVAGDGYKQYDYQLNENGQVVDHGHAPHDYLTDVLNRKGTDFIRSNAAANRPFYLQLNTFSPHGPSTPAPRHEGLFPGLTAPRGPAFNEADMSDKPGWLRGMPPLDQKQQAKIDEQYRLRAQSIQSINDMLADIRDTLQQTGQADNTYVVFSSDNGFHMGEHRLRNGKQTAFQTDVVVPLTITGPGVPAGSRPGAQVENIDLRPTFAELAGAPTPPDVDGRSFAAQLHGRQSPWRTASLVEHHGPNHAPRDPDRQKRRQGNPPTYYAIRTPEGTYVEYDNGDREYYDKRSDPDQLNNTYSNLSEQQRNSLHAALTDLRRCRGAAECFEAGRPA